MAEANTGAAPTATKNVEASREAMRRRNAMAETKSADPSSETHLAGQSDYDRGVRDGIDQALKMATEQAVMMADLALEGLPDNARNREAMEAALTRFSDKLRVTLTDLSLPSHIPPPTVDIAERLKAYIKHARENVDLMKSKTVRPDVVELASGMCDDLEELVLSPPQTKKGSENG